MVSKVSVDQIHIVHTSDEMTSQYKVHQTPGSSRFAENQYVFFQVTGNNKNMRDKYSGQIPPLYHPTRLWVIQPFILFGRENVNPHPS